MKGTKNRKPLYLLLYALPLIAFIFVFSYIPLFGWIYAFMDYIPGLSLGQMQFAGLKYFKAIFAPGSDFPNVMVNTLAISGLSLLTSLVPVVFSILISQVNNRGYKKIVQSVTSIPNFISWVLVYAICTALFSTDDGVVNKVLMTLGLVQDPVDILGNVKYAWYIQILIGMWKNVGWSAIVYLAAIVGIDQELYEAADIDGANRWNKIIHITLPGIIPTYMVLLLLQISNLLSNGFDQFWVFQNALTREKLEVFDTYVYRIGMTSLQYSLSTAIGILKSIVSIILLTGANFISKLIRGESII